MVSQRNWSIGNGKCHNRRTQLQPALDKVFAYRVSVHRFQEVGRPMKHVLDARAFFRGLGR